MKIKIINCYDPMMWYKNSMGLTFDIVSREKDAYWVRDNNGFLNIVMSEDAEILEI